MKGAAGLPWRSQGGKTFPGCCSALATWPCQAWPRLLPSTLGTFSPTNHLFLYPKMAQEMPNNPPAFPFPGPRALGRAGASGQVASSHQSSAGAQHLPQPEAMPGNPPSVTDPGLPTQPGSPWSWPSCAGGSALGGAPSLWRRTQGGHCPLRAHSCHSPSCHRN